MSHHLLTKEHTLNKIEQITAKSVIEVIRFQRYFACLIVYTRVYPPSCCSTHCSSISRTSTLHDKLFWCLVHYSLFFLFWQTQLIRMHLNIFGEKIIQQTNVLLVKKIRAFQEKTNNCKVFIKVVILDGFKIQKQSDFSHVATSYANFLEKRKSNR